MLLESVRAEIDGVTMPSWKRELILSLAEAQEKSPNASTSKELRLLMDEVGVVPQESGDVSDDLAAKRAARRAAG